MHIPFKTAAWFRYCFFPWITLVLCGLVLSGTSFGQEAAAVVEAPPARTEYLGRQIATTMHWAGAAWLIRDSREREEATSDMIRHLNLKPGQTVCDLGCGNGYHTLKMARLVGPKGRTLAVDVQPEMLKLLAARAAEQGIEGIETIVGQYTDPMLPPGKVDLVLLVDVYHEFSHPVEMLKKIKASLAPKGRIVLVEFRAEDESVPIKKNHKMSKEQILKELGANGFKEVERYDGLPWQHMIFFEAE